MLLGLVVEWGGTGNTGAGLATSYSVLTPTFNFGQGFGELPDTIGWARPFAVTGQVGYQVPTTSFDVGQGTFIPQVLVYGGSLQYSMAYLKSEVKDLGLPDFINHLIPIVEAQFATPVANNLGNSFVTTGTINPGVIWVGSYFQVGVEAIIPVNRDSGTGVGFLGQLHLYLDDIFPKSYGQPLIGGIRPEPNNAHLLRSDHAHTNIHPASLLLLLSAPGGARPRHARQCEPARRRIGRRGAAPGHAFVHARSRAGLQPVQVTDSKGARVDPARRKSAAAP